MNYLYALMYVDICYILSERGKCKMTDADVLLECSEESMCRNTHTQICMFACNSSGSPPTKPLLVAVSSE